ncbi:MAG: (2Fe-2S)-binding protein [Pseudonocardiaceae bacterium]
MAGATLPVAGARLARASATHPLAGSVAALDRTVEWMSFRLADEACIAWPEWSGCERALRDADFFAAWRAAIAERLVERHGTVPERTTGGYVLQWYLGVPGYTGAMLFHHSRRVPSLEPRRLAFRLEPAWVESVALGPGRFWCLPDDPDRRHPDAVVVADETALAAVLRQQFVAHAARFLRVFGPTVRFGRRTLWAAATDVLDSGLLMAGRSRGDDEAGVADARLVLGECHAPLTSASTTRALTDPQGRTHWTRARGSCCFYYALPGVAQACATCPRVDDAERARILGELQRD